MPHFKFMKTDYQYQLDSSSKKFICPACGKRRFVRYLDQETGDYLPEKYGICDRQINCSYNLNPYKDGFGRTNDATTGSHWTPPPPQPPQPPSHINEAVLRASLTAYHQNNFVKYLQSIFDKMTLSRLLNDYKIGTSKHWPGASVFWQIDQTGNVRSGKIMGYNPKTGHRIKEPFNHIQWTHKVLNIENYNLTQCLFGEHLLKMESTKPVAIVESEKTAVIASAYLPKFIWLAVGSLTNLNVDKCRPLAGRTVVLFPDLNAFEKWSQKAAEIEKALPGIKIKISDLLEKNATETERQNGFDLADYLTKFKVKDFQQPAGEPLPEMIPAQTLPQMIAEHLQRLNPEMWIICPQKYPELTAFNIEVLTDGFNQKHKMNISKDEYFRNYLIHKN